jgi:putative flippase GtrA
VNGGLLPRLLAHPAAQRLKIEIGRYTVVSAFNALLTFLIFFTLLKILHVNYLVALFASWLCGMIFSYCLNFVWVFVQPDALAFDHRFVKFAVSGLLSIGTNLIALRLLVESTGFDPFWVQAALVPAVVAFNFLTARFWSLVRADD